MLVLCIIFLASIGKSFGLRSLYIQILLKLFEYGRKNIESYQKLSIETNSKQTKAVKNGIVSHHCISQNVIEREPYSFGNEDCLDSDTANKGPLNNSDQQNEKHFDFQLSNGLDFIKSGMEAIIEDEVTSRFEAEELKNWNLLTRTNRGYEFISWRLTVIWMCGFFIRYFFLFPIRFAIFVFGVLWISLTNIAIQYVSNEEWKVWLYNKANLMAFRTLVRSVSAVITFHNTHFKPKNGGVCVANHTSPVDIAMLSTETIFSLIGQRHGGFLGLIQTVLARASPHIWFERSEIRDRHQVAKRLKEHILNPNNPPILIFPEGTCINNTSVMQFKKGSFEVGGTIYPVAIKYDPRFGDAFWNSSRYSMLQYLFMMMSSWAIVCDVWYLPPMKQKESESAIEFANRVKSEISKKGGLVDLMWDGQLKRMKPKKEWKEQKQKEFSKRLQIN